MTDINFTKLCDAYIIKKMSLQQINTEREHLSKALKIFYPKDQDEAFFYSELHNSLFNHKPHKDWTEELSKCYRFIEDEFEAKAYAKSLWGNNKTIPEIRNMLKIVGWDKPKNYYHGFLK